MVHQGHQGGLQGAMDSLSGGVLVQVREMCAVRIWLVRDRD